MQAQHYEPYAYTAMHHAQLPVACSKEALSQLLLDQWRRLSRNEIEKTRFIKREIALLIERKYGIRYTLTENYLSNLERALPLSV